MAGRKPDNILTLPRIPEPVGGTPRPVQKRVHAPSKLEGAGFPVRRPFPSGTVSFREADPFLLLDHIGAVLYEPGEAKGAPWHPHRGFETVTYMLDGAMRHQDTQGGGGLIESGDTQWMTAGSGLLHDEMPPEDLVQRGGWFHGAQLWVNLPRALKMTPPRYQAIAANRVTMLASWDGTAIVRLIAGDLAGFAGPGVTHTPIVYAHASLSPGGRLYIPWPAAYNAMVYGLSGQGVVGPDSVRLAEGDMALLGAGASLLATADARPDGPFPDWEILLMGGQPLAEPVAAWGPFVMSTHQEIAQAFEDYQAGRMGQIPVSTLEP